MWKKLLIYLIIFSVTLYLFFMYEDKIVCGLLAFEILYPITALFCAACLSKGLKIRFRKMLPIMEKSKTIPMKIEARNSSPFSTARFRIWATIGNQMSEEKVKVCLEGHAGPGKTAYVDCSFESEYCGNIICSLEKMVVYDFLGVFSWKIKLQEKLTVGILPECKLIPLEVTRRTREFIADADEYSTEKRGDDPMEIYQIRPYREKDSLHDIHWKLTAKEKELMVKEHGLPLGCVILIWLDLTGKGGV